MGIAFGMCCAEDSAIDGVDSSEGQNPLLTVTTVPEAKVFSMINPRRKETAVSHLTVKKILRSQGHSVVDAAAYCSAKKLLDERQGIEFDYSQKEGLIYSEILIPQQAPAWMRGCSILWNTVECIEKRKDACLARKIMIILASKFSVTQYINLLKAFCQNQFVSKGMAVDVNLYLDHTNNLYAHILLTTREIQRNGFGIKNTDWYKHETASKYHRALDKFIRMFSKTEA